MNYLTEKHLHRKKLNMRSAEPRRALALILCGLLLILCALPLFQVRAETAGADLEIRVGYFGDDADYRTKAVLTRADLEGLSPETYQYSNVTRVGTVMGTIARGPTIFSILDAAGIDAASVQTINLRTTDGTNANNWFISLNMDQWVNATRWYYPYLRENYERVEEEEGAEDPEGWGMTAGKVLPGEGALRGAKKVPAILAIESYSTKDPLEAIDAGMMNEDTSYRFCTGQSTMTDGEECGDYSSMNSAQWVFGIDVTLYGSPSEASGLELNLDQKDLVVGSTKQIAYTIYGQNLFEDKVSGNLSWTSSDPSVATVDQNGVVTILKKGKVTITATTENGISRSVTIDAVEKQEEKPEEEPKPEPEPKPENKETKSKDPGQPEEEKAAEEPVTVKKTEPPSRPEKVEKPETPQEADKSETPEEPEQSEDDGEPDESEQPEKKLPSGMREIILEDSMYDRQEMNAMATPLDAQKRNPLAAAIAMSGAGICMSAGGLLRFILYWLEVR